MGLLGIVLSLCLVMYLAYRGINVLILAPLLGALLLLIWPLQVLRLWRRYGDLAEALAMTFGKLPEAQGVVTYYWHRLTGAKAGLIEYK